MTNTPTAKSAKAKLMMKKFDTCNIRIKLMKCVQVVCSDHICTLSVVVVTGGTLSQISANNGMSRIRYRFIDSAGRFGSEKKTGKV
jgi:hypothetical protein